MDWAKLVNSFFLTIILAIKTFYNANTKTYILSYYYIFKRFILTPIFSNLYIIVTEEVRLWSGLMIVDCLAIVVG